MMLLSNDNNYTGWDVCVASESMYSYNKFRKFNNTFLWEQWFK